MTIAGFFLFFIGVILLICYPISKKKNARCSAQAQGTLVRIAKKEHKHVYVFSYNVDGIMYQLNSPAPSTEAKNVGDPCTIWYNPKKPKDAQAFHNDSDKVYKTILLSGLGLLLLGIVLIFIGAVLQFK